MAEKEETPAEEVAEEVEGTVAPGAVAQSVDLSPVLDAISGLRSDVMGKLDAVTVPAAHGGGESGGDDRDDTPIPRKPWTHRNPFGREDR